MSAWSLLRPLLASAALLCGFVPTGAVALAYVGVAAARRREGLDAGRAARLADRWIAVSLLIGAVVQAPVVLAGVV